MPPIWYKIVKSTFQCLYLSLQHGKQICHSSKTERLFLCDAFHVFVFPGLLASHCLNGTVKRKCLFTVVSGLLLCNHVKRSLSHRTAATSLSLPCLVCLVLSLSRWFFPGKNMEYFQKHDCTPKQICVPYFNCAFSLGYSESCYSHQVHKCILNVCFIK